MAKRNNVNSNNTKDDFSSPNQVNPLSFSNDLNTFEKGLNTDYNPLYQPKGTYRYALNVINETNEGDIGFISNEESNKPCGEFTEGLQFLGKVYIGNGETVLFGYTLEGDSEIGILKEDCSYTIILNDKDTPDEYKLGFNDKYPIQATYRLRRGCERTIYFTDNLNPPRYFNLDKPGLYKNDDGSWNKKKFNLFRNITKFPQYSLLRVKDNLGKLKSGSYSIFVQYLDDDFNPTQWFELANNINIYNDSLNKDYSDIIGSSSLKQDNNELFYSLPTNKGIEIKLNNIDTDFPYIRFAFAEYVSGTGVLTTVNCSDKISTKNPYFIYTGENTFTSITQEELELFSIGIGVKKAQHVEQIENRLLLANTQGEDYKVCDLQKYASKINADCIIKEVVMQKITDPKNPKNPLVKVNGTGYMPGEVYSFGIQYLFEDGSISPVYHIPGKSKKYSNEHIFSTGNNVKPMRSENNTNNSEKYLETNLCNDISYWGKDSFGDDLKGNNVRHHRFPTREEIGVDFVEEKVIREQIDWDRIIILNSSGTLRRSFICNESLQSSNISNNEEELQNEQDVCIPYEAPKEKIVLKYNIDDVEYVHSLDINPESNKNHFELITDFIPRGKSISNISLQSITKDINNNDVIKNIGLDSNNTSEELSNGLKFSIEEIEIRKDFIIKSYTAPIFGIKFSNIEIPTEQEIGKKIIGYQIVRQERKDIDKTILDTAVILPCTEHKDEIVSGYIAPYFWSDFDGYPNEYETNITQPGHYNNLYTTTEETSVNRCSKNYFHVLSMKHLFQDKTFDEFTHIKEIGVYKALEPRISGFSYGDVISGSSSDSIKTTKDTSDTDGFSLKQFTRYTEVKYFSLQDKVNQFSINYANNSQINAKFNINNSNTKTYNLEAINYTGISETTKTLYNLSCDSKALIISKESNNDYLLQYRNKNRFIPYVSINRNHSTFYQSFRISPYYATSTKIFNTNNDTCEVFGGDSYIVPYRHTNHIFTNVVTGHREQKAEWWKVLINISLAIAGVVLTIISFGSSAPLSLAMISLAIGGLALTTGSILFLSATLLDIKRFNEIYTEKWQKGLQHTLWDFHYKMFYINYKKTISNHDQLRYQDDTFRWIGEVVGDFWFETDINTSLRLAPKEQNITNFLRPLKQRMNHRTDVIDLFAERRNSSLPNNFHGQWQDSCTWFNDCTVGGTIFKDYMVTENLEKEDVYFRDKITIPNQERKHKREYMGISLPIVYGINPDHNINTNIKKYYMLPDSYDCCSNCIEKFPHRVYYSQQSFQEEKTDNYRMFLPNNYRDIEGETGEITNVFRYYNNLYIHTEEALWQLPRNYQERVTDQIVSFIGTGSYFEIPPQKIKDDDSGNSAGCIDKLSLNKNPHGFFFVSQNQNKIYQFDGKQLKPISIIGMQNWLENNIKIQGNKDFKLKLETTEHPYKNIPYHWLGTGFISVYDSKKERVLFTKKDALYQPKGMSTPDLRRLNLSWTLSYCLKTNTWTSFHSYHPLMYISTPDKLYSITDKSNKFWKHNIKGNYLNFYGVNKPYIIEFISSSTPLTTKTWNHLQINTSAYKYDYDKNEFYDKHLDTFNYITIYNSYQCSGRLNMINVDEQVGSNDMFSRVVNTNNNVIYKEKVEKNWYINQFRDYRVDYNQPIWDNNQKNFINTYLINTYIDKQLNNTTIDYNKNIYSLSDFKDKWIGYRLEFHNEDSNNIKLLTNFVTTNEQNSFH